MLYRYVLYAIIMVAIITMYNVIIIILYSLQVLILRYACVNGDMVNIIL